MLLERYADDFVVWAPAKVNLYLEVLTRRPDGYHELETLLVAVSLYDTLVFKEDASGHLQLRCNHPELSTGPENLVLRAARLLQQHTSCVRGAHIRLVKRIPLAAGLAGGSTDAAATLAGLNRLWRLGLTADDLTRLAGQLGSDVAFFFSTPAAWCTGRGEQVAAQPLGKQLWLVLVCPPYGLSTAEVYRGLTVPESPHTGDALRAAVAAGQVEEIGRRLHNRLQAVAERLRPELTAELARLAALGPAGCQMSGSGTSLFALCRDRREGLRLVQELRNRTDRKEGLKVYLVRSCS
jgi:4-diphosphocytidyl-2-C-methyl-D-erythritol kinase